jgi:membrane-associated phospholipid phosphatase
MEFFKQFDLKLLSWLNQSLANSFCDWFFPLMAAPRYFYIPLGLLALGLLFRGGRRARVFLGMVAVTLFLGDAMIVANLKKWTNRPRPHEAVIGVRKVTREEVVVTQSIAEVQKGRSFPSAHVCNNVALAVMVSAFFGKRWRWLYGWALLMSWNRIYLGAHYPSDVFFSWLIAWIYASGILKVYVQLFKNHERFYVPIYRLF